MSLTSDIIELWNQPLHGCKKNKWKPLTPREVALINSIRTELQTSQSESGIRLVQSDNKTFMRRIRRREQSNHKVRPDSSETN